MKALIVFAVLLFGFWLWRSGRKSVRDDRPADAKPDARAPAPGPAVEMVACRHCGVHCALPDSVAGRSGPYCSHEHRRLAEG